MQEAYAHCDALVRAMDRDRYLATLLLPEPARRHAFALYAFNAEVASVRERAGGSMAGEIRLQWWRDVLAGEAAGDPQGSPVATALIDTIDREELPRAVFENVIEARSFDLYDDPMATTSAFEGYVRATTSSLFSLAARLLDRDEASSDKSAVHAGLAFGTVGLLRAFPLHASRGQIYLPGDLLARYGVRPEEVLGGRPTPAMLSALAEMRDFARTHLATAIESLKARADSVWPAFLPAALVDGYLRRMEWADYDPFRTAIEVPQWRRQWVLWRAARRGLKF